MSNANNFAKPRAYLGITIPGCMCMANDMYDRARSAWVFNTMCQYIAQYSNKGISWCNARRYSQVANKDPQCIP